ncbi:MAG: ROK family protein [Bacteroidetes bacterium]|nr:ROK family protein [Bacteroidota bacterium]MDA1334383.1 ROK family protein [Bacteroidota bacterium]
MSTPRLSIGIDLGGTSIKAGLISDIDGLIDERSVITEAESGHVRVLDQISDLVSGFLRTDDAIEGIGIGFPGAVNWERTVASKPVNIADWEHVHMPEAINSRLGTSLPVLVENDANAAALGSARFGAGRDFDSFIMITLGTGVGGAIIYQKKIFRGATGAAGEIGHMTIDFEGPLARSGVAGAIEAYLGQRFLSRHARYQLLNEKDSLVHGMAGPDLLDISPKILYEAALQGDAGSTEILAWAGNKLGIVLGSAINLLDIRKVVVGGGLSAAGDFILASARKSMVDFTTPALRDGLEIVQESSGNEAGMLGAGYLVFEQTDEVGSD